MVTQPSDRFVWTHHNSSVLGVGFPLMPRLGELGQEGKGGCAGSLDSGCGQLDRQFEFLSTAGLKFQPLKIEVINVWGSQNNL